MPRFAEDAPPPGGRVHSSYFPKSQSCCMRNVLPQQKVFPLLPGDFYIYMEMAHWRSGGRGGGLPLGELGTKGCGLTVWLWIQVAGNLVHLIPINLTTRTPRRHEWKASSFHRRTLVGKHTDFPYLEPS